MKSTTKSSDKAIFKSSSKPSVKSLKQAQEGSAEKESSITSEKILGHSELIRVLLNSAVAGTFEGSFLFSGPSGIGKSKVAVLLAQALLCESSKQPCGVCSSCVRVQKLQHESLMWVRPDGLQIKIESAHQIIQFLSLKKIHRYNIVVIEEAHKLNIRTGNALLKTLEEPPAGTVFILLSSQPSSLLPTIRSRVRNFSFSPLSDIELKELRPHAPDWVIKGARGRMDRVEQLLEPEMRQRREQIVYAFFQFFKETVEPDVFKWVSQDAQTGLFVLEVWMQLLRDWALLQIGGHDLIHPDIAESIKAISLNKQSFEALVRALDQARFDIEGHIDKGLIWDQIHRTFHQTIQ